MGAWRQMVLRMLTQVFGPFTLLLYNLSIIQPCWMRVISSQTTSLHQFSIFWIFTALILCLMENLLRECSSLTCKFLFGVVRMHLWKFRSIFVILLFSLLWFLGRIKSDLLFLGCFLFGGTRYNLFQILWLCRIRSYSCLFTFHNDIQYLAVNLSQEQIILIIVRAHGVFIRFTALWLNFLIIVVGVRKILFVLLLLFFLDFNLVEQLIEGSILHGKLADEVINFFMSLLSFFIRVFIMLSLLLFLIWHVWISFLFFRS